MPSSPTNCARINDKVVNDICCATVVVALVAVLAGVVVLVAVTVGMVNSDDMQV